MTLKILSLLLAGGALVSACGDGDGGTAPENAGRIRFVQISPGGPDLDILIDNVEVATSAPYLTVTDYFDVEAGSRNLLVRDAESGEVVLDEVRTVADGVDYTVLLEDVPANLTLTYLTDDNTPSSTGDAKVRLIHSARAAGLVDIYVTAPGADITQETPRLAAVAFGGVSPYVPVAPDGYQVRITRAGTTDVLIDRTIELSPGQVRTGIAVESAEGGEPYDALILEDLD